MQTFQNEAAFLAWTTEMREASKPGQQAWMQETAIDMGYYEGVGSMQRSTLGSGTVLERLKTELNIDSPMFRSKLNRTTPLVQRKAAATHPTAITIRAKAPDRNLGPTGTVQAQLDEDTANVLIDETRFVKSWQNANHMRWVTGCHGVGLALRQATRELVTDEGSVAAPSLVMSAFDFLAIKLITDPGIQERDLSDHDWTMLTDVWSIHKLNRLLGPMLEQRKIVLDPDKMRSMGDLNSFELTLCGLTQGRLFSHFKAHSKTKGALVTQVHRKDDRGIFSRMEIVIELQPGSPILLNKDNPLSPYGGNGLPLRLLHGHRRSESMQSIGAARMLKDDQDRLDRNQTCLDRQTIHSSKHQVVVDQGWLGVKSEKEAAKRITNAVGGIIFGNSGGKDKQYPEPKFVNIPPPQAHFSTMIAGYEDAMRRQVHSSPGSFGETLSHVPDRSFQRALDEGGAVDDQIVFEDKTTCESLLAVAVGTAKKLAREQDPGMLSVLDKHGFTGDEMLRLAQSDPTYPACSITISDGSIRVRSWNAKKQDLDAAAMSATPMIDPKTYRREMAGSLDAPLIADDKLFGIAFDKMAADVLTGAKEFVPIPLDADRAADLMHALQRAMVSREAQSDPLTLQRVAGAIQSQRQLMAEEAARMQAAVGAQGVGVGQTNQSADGQTPEQGNFSALVDMLSSQSQAA